jgi:hypothetical protein
MGCCPQFEEDNMKDCMDIASPDVWKSILTPDEYKHVEELLNSLKWREEQPTVSEFLSGIRRSLEAGLIKREAAV